MGMLIAVGNSAPDTNTGPLLSTGGTHQFSVQGAQFGTVGQVDVTLQYITPGGTVKSAFGTSTTTTDGTALNAEIWAPSGTKFYIDVANAAADTDIEVYLSGVVNEAGNDYLSI